MQFSANFSGLGLLSGKPIKIEKKHTKKQGKQKANKYIDKADKTSNNKKNDLALS